MIQSTAIENELDVYAVRRHFPALTREVKGKPLVYFDNAATTQKPQVVIDALVEYYSKFNANIHRGIHTLAEEATAAFESTRDTVQRFINSPTREQIIFTGGTTEGINLVAQTWGRQNIKKGDEILISAMEHHSNIVPWYIVAQEKGAVLKVIPVNDDGELVMSEFEKLLTEKTKIVAVVHASNALGTINPVKKIIDAAHKAGAVVLVDGAQSSVHLDIDVQALDCDFFAFSSHKIYGPTGVGVLYGKKQLLEDMPVYQGGGEMIREVSYENISYNDLPYKFEAGTPNIADAIAFKAALDFTSKIGKEKIRRHEHELLAYATEKLEAIPGLKIIGRAKNKVSLISFVMDKVHPQDLGILLDNRGIAVRTGHHCAQPLMDRYCIPGTTRASFAMYNTKEEIDELIIGLNKAVKNVAVMSEHKNIEQIEAEIVDEFSLFDSWDDKYEYIIDLGKKLPPLDEQHKKDENKVKGCQSTVWLVAEYKDGSVFYKAESDAVIVKGLISMLIRVLSGQAPDDIVKAPLNFIKEIGMMSHLAQTRSNGLLSMVKQMKNYALAYKLQNA